MARYLGPKTHADNLATQGDLTSGGAPLSDATPDAITPDQAGAAGTASTAARADHSHEINAAAPSSNLTASTTNGEGSSSSFSRADHSHAITTASAGAITGTAGAGTSASLARADHDHSFGTGSIATAALADGAVTAAKLNADTFGKAQTLNAQTGAYTLASSDAGKLVTVNTSSNVTITINTSTGLSAGQRIDLLTIGTGTITVASEAAPNNVTLNATPGAKLRARYSGATLLCVGSNDYVLIGDLAA